MAMCLYQEKLFMSTGLEKKKEYIYIFIYIYLYVYNT